MNGIFLINVSAFEHTDAQITYALTMHCQHVSTDSSNTRERHEISIPLPEIYSVRSERKRYSSSSIRKSRIDRRWKWLVKFLKRCSEMLCGNWYMPSRRRTKLRDAVLHSEATCPKVKSTIETDSDDISVVTAHTHVFAFRVRIPTYIPVYVIRSNLMWHACGKERRA